HNPRPDLYPWEVKPHAKEDSVLVAYDEEKKRPALVERHMERDQGRVLLSTTLMDYMREPIWNNYGQNSFYLVLTALATNYLAGNPDDVNLNFISGQGDPSVTIP